VFGDVTTLIPVIDRLRRRFDIGRVCVIADRGMISAETMAELEARRLLYSDKLVRDLVLNDPAPFVPLVVTKRGKQVDYDAKAVVLAGRRYIVCRNHVEAANRDETIRGHVFCSFLALVLKKALEDLIAALGRVGSWPEIIANLDSLTETEVEQDGKRFIIRSAPRAAASLAVRAAGVALPPTIRQAADLDPSKM
jgi:hypothetical protein